MNYMNKLLRIFILAIGWLILPFCVCAVEPAQPLSVAERNALQGFNDTIDREAEDFIETSVVVVEPSGEAMYSVLGHSCLHLKCTQFGLDKFYSYVSEDIERKVFRFLMNDLRMGLVELTRDEFLQEYMKEGRGVKEYKLNLPPEVEMELWRICDLHVSQGLNLKYDYITRGCAISVVHSVENAIQATNHKYGKNYKIEYAAWSDNFSRTLREIGYDFSKEGWLRFFGMTLIGGEADNPNIAYEDKLIIPCELAETWQKATINGKLLLESKYTELLPPVKEYKGDNFTPLYVSLILLLIATGSLFWEKKYIDWVILTIQTIIGCLILWLLVSPLPGSDWYWLIIPFNPLPVLFWKWREKWAIPYAAIEIVWCVGMICAPHRLVEYAHIILVIAFTLILMKTKIRNLIITRK